MTLNILDEINKAEREVANSLKSLEALLKERGMRVADIRTDKYTSQSITEREVDQIFSAEITVEPRRVL